jgi:hypothetical protein
MDFPSMRRVEAYEPPIGAEALARIYRKAQSIKHLHVTKVNSICYGGGGAQLLSSPLIWSGIWTCLKLWRPFTACV